MEEEFDASVDLLEATRVAFEVAGKFLSETDDFLFVYYLKNGERKLSQIEGCVTQDDVFEKVRELISHFGDITLFVQVSRAEVLENDEAVDVIVAHCAEMGQSEGVVMLQRLDRDEQSERFVPTGEISMAARMPNEFWTTH